MDKNEIRETIARRVALELKDGDVVNLGIGLPTMVPNYLKADVEVMLQSENGMIGMGPAAKEGEEAESGPTPEAVLLHRYRAPLHSIVQLRLGSSVVDMWM